MFLFDILGESGNVYHKQFFNKTFILIHSMHIYHR